jgi:AcrR family transcriptional regulator
MGVKGAGNRQRIVDAANNLFYRRGYNQTSFQDISDETGIPRGNFYYYFKTKDEILNAVIDSRVLETNVMLKQCEVDTDDARERLLVFSNMLENNREDVVQSGCSIGTLNAELAKDNSSLHEKSGEVFILLRDWAKQQFDELGLDNTDDLAMDLLAKIQGVTVVACAFKDDDFVKRSHQEIKEWINNKTLS